MSHKKTTLPEKICVHCQRHYTWRRKWSRCWEEVRFCSQGCKRAAKQNYSKSKELNRSYPGRN
jgi:hypothetical protein